MLAYIIESNKRSEKVNERWHNKRLGRFVWVKYSMVDLPAHTLLQIQHPFLGRDVWSLQTS